jgi:hypothetical protein
MSTDNLSNPTGHGPSIKINFNNPQCILWAVLALARLDEKIPSNEEALLLFEHGTPWAYGVRRTLNAVVKTFCDERMEDTWSTAETDHPLRIQRLTVHLKGFVAKYQEHTGATSTPDREIEYLHKVFQAFCLCIARRPDTEYSEAFGALGMLMAVAIKVATLCGRIIFDMFDTFNAFAAQKASQEVAARYTEEQLDLICAAIEHFVREHPDLNTVGDYDEDRSIGEAFVRLIRAPLHQRVQSLFKMLIVDLDFRADRVVDEYDPMVKARVAVFHRQVARFFSYASPLFNAYFSVPDFVMMDEEDEGDGDEDREQDVPEHVADHDFSRYEEGDWHQDEGVLFDVQDVLTGPEHADLTDVSTAATTSADTACSLCGDAAVEMRKLNACGHELCATCLTGQLNVEHECRYKCAACRAEFFPDFAS